MRTLAIVIGFVGEVQLDAHLRADYPDHVYAEVFENRHREKAHRKILALLGTSHDARVIIYAIAGAPRRPSPWRENSNGTASPCGSQSKWTAFRRSAKKTR
jgi:hypothetical protein